MMIEHDHVHAASLKLGNLSHRSGPAIDGHEQLRPILLETTLDTFAAQAVALLHAQGQKQFRRATVCAQHFREQRKRSHPIYIVIAEEHNAFVLVQCSENTRNRRFHLRQQKWIAQRTEARAEEVFNFLHTAKSFSREQSRDAFRSANFAPRNGAAIQLLARRQNPAALPRKSSRTLPLLQRCSTGDRCIDCLDFYAALH